MDKDADMNDAALRTRTRVEEVTEKFSRIRFMDAPRAEAMREIITGSDARDILEIGFYHGKSSAYFAAILEDLGRGALTTIDVESARAREPNIHDLLAAVGVAHRVTPVYAHRSFTWELQKLIAQTPRPMFDLCYFDGGHIWDSTGFGVMLVDMLLRPGGILVLDDMDWTAQKSRYYRRHTKVLNTFSRDESSSPAVRLTWDLILPHLGYEKLREIGKFAWGVARKPATGRA